MSKTVKKAITDEVEELLKKLDIKESNYEKKSNDPESSHTKTIEAFNKFWFSKYPYIEQYGLQNIDFLGKEGKPEGPILVAMEVDAGWWRATESCVKLANIRAENKFWIHVTNDKDAKENFNLALEDIQKILTMRSENKEIFGNFVAFLKTPKDLQMKRIF